MSLRLHPLASALKLEKSHPICGREHFWVSSREVVAIYLYGQPWFGAPASRLQFRQRSAQRVVPKKALWLMLRCHYFHLIILPHCRLTPPYTPHRSCLNLAEDTAVTDIPCCVSLPRVLLSWACLDEMRVLGKKNCVRWCRARPIALHV